ncbi:MAG: hypothetical protein IJJ15_04270 [Ruminococcus sp.]|nr:hypothetical protein [Ruminococcus sp.]
MKKYVFLTFAVAGIGGTQIYVRNKILFLRSLGWDVTVICSETGDDVVVKELIPFKGNAFPELIKNPFLFSKKQRVAIIDRMKDCIGTGYDQTVIETNMMFATPWGELLAKEIQAKHFIFLIQEDYSLSDIRYMKFFDFKYQRGELAANTKYALKQLFEGYRTIPDDKNGELLAVCYNVVEECESEHDSGIIDADYHVGSIGRVNKPFVLPMVKDIVSFADAHNEKTVQLVLFGGSPEQKDYDAIYAAVKEAANFSVYITGPIFPVPRHLLAEMDVFVSSAGAARTSADEGFITIAIDANDYEPIGVVGYTTDEIVHRNPDLPHESTQRLLERILIDKEFAEKTTTVAVSNPDYMEVFKEHMEYIERSADTLDYYDIRLLKPKTSGIVKYRIMKELK